jgi:lipoprotein-releasing system permease protein
MAKLNRHIFMIAYRQLRNRRRQAALTISGIAVGVMVLVTAVSLMDGLLQSFIEKIVNNAPHLTVSGERVKQPVPDMLLDAPQGGSRVDLIKNTERQDEEVIKNYAMVETQVRSEPLVTAVSPMVLVNTIGSFGTLSVTMPVLGVLPEEADKIQHFRENMVTGKFEELGKTPDGVIVGSSLAKNLTVRTGDRLDLIGTRGDRFAVRVVGTFSTGINDIDNNAYVNLPLAQMVGGFPADEVTQLALRLSDIAPDAAVARSIAGRTNYRVKTWEENSSSIIGLFRMISGIVYFLVFFVILVAGFGVANILITNVLEKYRDIAIMKSMGFRRGEITAMYMLQGTLVAAIGAFIGCLLGAVMIQVLSSIPITPSQQGLIRSDRLLMKKDPAYYALASAFSFVVCLIASLGPSRRAAGVNPVDILRGER